VLNKIDLLAPEDRPGDGARFARSVRWKGPVFVISGATGEGCKALVDALDRRLSELQAERAERSAA
jgi:GTPase